MDKTYRASRKSPSALTSPDKLSLVVTLTDTAVTYVQGILAKRTETVPYNKINSVNVQQGPLEATLNYGTVIIATGNDVEPITLDDIDSPGQLRDDITAMMQQSAAPLAQTPITPIETPSAPAQTPEDEIIKLSELLQQGMITQAEFDAKKTQLLGL